MCRAPREERARPLATKAAASQAGRGAEGVEAEAQHAQRALRPAERGEEIADHRVRICEEGRDLTDDEAYRHLLEKYQVPAEAFFEKLHSPAYRERAYEEFELVKHLKVTGFPTVLLQLSELRHGRNVRKESAVDRPELPGNPR